MPNTKIIPFTDAERKAIDEAFQQYTQALSFVSRLMTHDGRLSGTHQLQVAEDRSGFVVPVKDDTP